LLAAGAGLALGAFNPLLRPLFEHPGLGSLRVPARWILLSVWALWMSACVGWKSLRTSAVRASLLQGALAALLLADLVAWDSPFLYSQDPARYLAVSPVVAQLRASGQRFATAPDIPNPNKGMLYRLPNVTGYEAFYLAGAALHASRAQGEASADGSRTSIRRPEAFKDVSLRWYLDEHSIAEVKDAQPLVYHAGSKSPDADAPAFTQPTAERWEIVWRPASGVRGPASKTHDAGRTTQDAKTPLIVAQAYYPGWRAWSGDAEVPLEEHAGFLQRIVVAPTAPVHLRFDPWLWTASRWLSVFALVFSLSWIHRYFIPRAS